MKLSEGSHQQVGEEARAISLGLDEGVERVVYWGSNSRSRAGQKDAKGG